MAWSAIRYLCPVDTRRAAIEDNSKKRLRRADWGGAGAEGRSAVTFGMTLFSSVRGRLAEPVAQHVLADLAGGSHRERAGDQPAHRDLRRGQPGAAELRELGGEAVAGRAVKVGRRGRADRRADDLAVVAVGDAKDRRVGDGRVRD